VSEETATADQLVQHLVEEWMRRWREPLSQLRFRPRVVSSYGGDVITQMILIPPDTKQGHLPARPGMDDSPVGHLLKTLGDHLPRWPAGARQRFVDLLGGLALGRPFKGRRDQFVQVGRSVRAASWHGSSAIVSRYGEQGMGGSAEGAITTAPP